MSFCEKEINRDRDEMDAPAESVDLSVLAGLAEEPDGEDSGLVVDLIDLYLEDSSAKLNALRAAVADGDGAAVRAAAHSLKGSSDNLGVRRVAGMCRELEGAGQLGRGAEILGGLEREYERVTQIFTAERRKRRP